MLPFLTCSTSWSKSPPESPLKTKPDPMTPQPKESSQASLHLEKASALPQAPTPRHDPRSLPLSNLLILLLIHFTYLHPFCCPHVHATEWCLSAGFCSAWKFLVSSFAIFFPNKCVLAHKSIQKDLLSSQLVCILPWFYFLYSTYHAIKMHHFTNVSFCH